MAAPQSSLLWSQAPVTKHSPEPAAREWLRQRVEQEGAYRVFEGTTMIVVGAIISLVIPVIPSAWITRLAVIFQSGRSYLDAFDLMYCIVLAGSIALAYIRPWGEDESGLKVSLELGGSGGSLQRGANLILGVLCLGPQLVFLGVRSIGKYVRLRDADIGQITPIILWLIEHKGRGSVETMAHEFPLHNSIRIFPQMRDIPGVLWRADGHGVIELTEDFQRAFSRAIFGESKFRKSDGAPRFADGKTSERRRTATAEIAEWYRTLELPPYAPLREVKKKYRQLAKRYHPDAREGKGGDEQIKRINAAYANIMKGAMGAG